MQSLERYKSAQADPIAGFEVALAEIDGGRKRGHWIWYVFPQLAGLGRSGMAQAYALGDRAEAEAYLRDPELRARLLMITKALATQLNRPGASIERIMGSHIDALKVVSSLTLFEHVARTLADAGLRDALMALANAAEDVLTVAALHGYPRCQFTLDRIRD